MSSKSDKPLFGFVLGVLIWFAPACFFLSLFLYRHEGNGEGAILHLQVVGILFLLVTCIRAVCYRCLPLRPAAFIGAMAYTGLLAALLAYYVAALIGLDGWGRLISWALIATYATQSDYLLKSLGIYPEFFWGIVVLFYLVFLGILHSLFLRRDGLRSFVLRVSDFTWIGATAATVAVGTLFFWRFQEFPMAADGEPLSVMFYPELVGEKFQSHYKFHSKALGESEKLLRQSYLPSNSINSANVILIVVDALRADHLSINGYARQTTPYLQELLSSGQWKNFGKIYSVCAESACGLMALSSSRNIHLFIDHPITLQEALKRNGYGIHLVLGGDHTNFYGLRKAYGEVDSYFDASMNKGRYVNDDAAVIDQLASFPTYGGNPTFMQFHLMSAHGLGARENSLAPFQPSRNYYGDIGARILLKNDGRTMEYVNYYDNGVRKADDVIKSLMNMLRSKGYLKNTIVVITADHGEYLGEGGQYGHAKGVGEPVLGIPMLLGRYGGGYILNKFGDNLMSQIDIAPTVLHELGISIPASWAGLPMQSQGRRFAYFQQNRAYGLIEKKSDGSVWKYWMDAGKTTEHLYEISADPSEANNRSNTLEAEQRSQWRRQLIDLEVNARQSLDAAP
ncbi:sulfatase-like hydrolase/transferase [Acidovorax delafieldii]|uniref:sulfatase-like hydrolase/transferase n=1 Tax=Acidovorax delafieldii TaxID=47920 RepID=UPI003ED05771